MVNYEEAKKIALELLGEMAIHINEAFETEDAYIFNDSKHIYAGWIPIVIRKSDGHRVHYGNINPLLWGEYKVYNVRICV